MRVSTQVGWRIGKIAMNFEEASAMARTFRDERDWAKFHNPKDLSIALSVEASELLDVFRWSGAETSAGENVGSAIEELADVAIYCIYLSDALGVELAEAIASKMKQNALKYPVEKSRGNARKYTQL